METISVGTPAIWIGFLVFVLAMLALDLGVFNRKAHVISNREALIWSGVWIALALIFNAIIWIKFGSRTGVEFLTGYLIEKSLSIDNIFVFVVVFSGLSIPAIYQHRVLYWGIVSALVLRAAMIVGGAAALDRFHWIIYVFGVFLIATGIKLYVQRGKTDHPEEGRVLRWARRWIPSTPHLNGSRFLTKVGSRTVATPLLMALILVEITDIIFAVDSIPAIFAVTRDPFIVFTSNIFAILGLRSLYFLLAGMVERFRYLKVGLAAVLVFVGMKMTLVDVYKMPAIMSLAVIVGILGISIGASLLRRDSKASHGSAAQTVRIAESGR
jgi:tellurite resistance protein TerC